MLYDLNNFTTGFMAAVNTQHNQGYDLNGNAGLNLFTGTGASDIQLNAAITDPSMVAAATALAPNPAPPPANIPAPGDGGNALFIGNFQTNSNPSGANAMVINGKTITANEFYNNQMTAFGLNITKATNEATYQGQVKDALSTQRDSVSGVNLNEEAADLVKSQRAYEAAARLMTTVDTMLSTVISSMGLVGR
jgi:flagellar hook-associated protein 1 FlgK